VFSVASNVCFKCFIWTLHIFCNVYTCVFLSVSDVCCKCSSCFERMLQVFLNVAKVDLVLHMLQWDPPAVVHACACMPASITARLLRSTYSAVRWCPSPACGAARMPVDPCAHHRGACNQEHKGSRWMYGDMIWDRRVVVRWWSFPNWYGTVVVAPFPAIIF
jgi:hypothetical protein